MKINKSIRPEYKFVKVMKPHCPTCNERLMGNNSISQPYVCSCGIWKQNTEDLTFNILNTKGG